MEQWHTEDRKVCPSLGFPSFLFSYCCRSGICLETMSKPRSSSPKAQRGDDKHGISMLCTWTVKKPPMMGLYISRVIYQMGFKPSWAIG